MPQPTQILRAIHAFLLNLITTSVKNYVYTPFHIPNFILVWLTLLPVWTLICLPSLLLLLLFTINLPRFLFWYFYSTLFIPQPPAYPGIPAWRRRAREIRAVLGTAVFETWTMWLASALSLGGDERARGPARVLGSVGGYAFVVLVLVPFLLGVEVVKLGVGSGVVVE